MLPFGIDHVGVAKNKDRCVFQKKGFFQNFKFMRKPNIVLVSDGDEVVFFSDFLDFFQRIRKSLPMPAVFWAYKNLHGKFRSVFLEDRKGVVIRGVVDSNDTVGLAILRQQRIEHRSKEPFSVISGECDENFRHNF